MTNRCACGCCHVPDHGACDTFERGMNGRCVYCDHGEECHPGSGEAFNLPLSTGFHDVPTTCSTVEPPSLTLEGLAATMRYFNARKGPYVTYQVSEHVPEEIVDPKTGEVSHVLVMPDALSCGRALTFFHPSHEAEFVEACRREGIAAVPVDWKHDLPTDKWLKPIPYIEVGK